MCFGLNERKKKIRQVFLLLIVLVGLMGVATATLYAAPPLQLTKVFEWGTGSYSSIEVKGNYAYCAASAAGLDIIDISNPSAPVIIGNCDLPGYATYVALSGKYAYVANSTEYVQVVDISNPASPKKVGTAKTENTVVFVLVSGKYLFASTYGYGVYIFDISNPKAPVKKGTYTSNAYVTKDIVVSGNTMYVTWTFGFEIVDISNPAKPVKLGSYWPQAYIYPGEIAISGNYAFVSESKNSMLVLDISTPSNPTLLGTWEGVGGGFSHIEIREGKMYTVQYFGSCRIFDITDPLSPVVLGSCGLPDVKHDFALSPSGDHMYIAGDEEGLYILDTSNPSDPVAAGSLDKSGNFFAVELKGKYAYLIGHSISIFDISNPGKTTLAAASKLWTGGTASTMQGHYLYTVGNGFRGYSIANPLSPAYLFYFGRYLMDEDTDIAVKGNYAYVTDADEGFLIFDITDPSHAFHVGNLSYGGKGIAIKGNYLYLNAYNGFATYDITNPKWPVLISEKEDLWGNWTCVDPAKPYAYITVDYSPSIVAIDISDPANLQKKGSISMPVAPANIYVSGNYAFVSDRDKGLRVVDISNPNNLTLAGSFSTVGDVSDVKVNGDYIYLADGGSGKFYILKMSQVLPQSVTVTNPNGGETWQAGTTHNITWVSTGIEGNVSIELFQTGAPVLSIGEAPVSAGTFSWAIPTSITPAADYKIRITSNGVSDDSDEEFSVIAPPAIALNRNKLYFGALEGEAGQTTPAQAVKISSAGSGTLHWTATPSQTWITVTPGSGTGNKTITVGVNTGGLSAGTYTGTVSITDPGASNSPQSISVILKVFSTGTPPFGEFSSPSTGSTVRGSIPVTGWVLDDVDIVSVKIYRHPTAAEGEGNGDVFIGNAVLVEGARPDIELQYPDYPMNYTAGWGYMLLTNVLPDSGNGTFYLLAKASDVEGNETLLGEKTIICDNAHAVKPFGAIDTPTQGGTASGKEYINYGWALTPVPNTIPIDGSTISVWVDGKNIGHPVYSQYRSDVATIFPGYFNSNGAGGYFFLNTMAYDDGVHTIGWSVKDNAGNEDGIGSRFFTINNTTSSSGAAISNFQTSTTESPNTPVEMFPFIIDNQIIDDNNIPVDYFSPVRVRRGFNSKTPFSEVYPDQQGVIHVQLKPLERIEIHLNSNPGKKGDRQEKFPGPPKTFDEKESNSEQKFLEVQKPFFKKVSGFSGYSLIGDELRSLPIGSTLDSSRGVFYWQPGPGFTGRYSLVFILKTPDGQPIRKSIEISMNLGNEN